MKTLLGTASNNYISMGELEGGVKYAPLIELILIETEKNYSSGVSGLQTEDSLSTHRVMVDPDVARKLSARLLDWADASEEMAEKRSELYEPGGA